MMSFAALTIRQKKKDVMNGASMGEMKNAYTGLN
jgi:hypothetical protein